jgi:hypothetical protein
MHPISPINTVAGHSMLQPLMEALKINNNLKPANSLPINTNGTLQQNAKKSIHDVIYDSYGRIRITPEKILLGYA